MLYFNSNCVAQLSLSFTYNNVISYYEQFYDIKKYKQAMKSQKTYLKQD